jgi:hypothetical protein
MRKHTTFLIIVLAILVACADDPLAERKKRCDSYVQSGDLQSSDKSNCYTDEKTYRKGAQSYSAATSESLNLSLQHAHDRLDAEFRLRDVSKFIPAPKNLVLFEAFHDEKASNSDRRYKVDLSSVTFSRPGDEDLTRDYKISGTNDLNGELVNMPILGVPAIAFRNLIDVCDLVAYSKETKGCQATIYFDLDADGDVPSLPDFVVLALKFTPPVKDEVFASILQAELAQWSPKPKRR